MTFEDNDQSIRIYTFNKCFVQFKLFATVSLSKNKKGYIICKPFKTNNITNFKKCSGRDLNPYSLMATCPSNMLVYQFQHLSYLLANIVFLY